jgi:hypothetical protein
MAFECGMLGTSSGRSPKDALAGLMEHLQGAAPGISFEEVKVGEGWAATRIRARGASDSKPGQYVQVSVGGVILDVYREAARQVVGGPELAGKDLMMTMTLSGDVDTRLTESAMGYARTEWRGIPWDETSGFTASV